jgi:predicted phage terminase large subunit-like protein
MARRVRFWDLAATASADADCTAGVKMCRQENRYLIEDVVRGRWGPFDRDAMILQTAHLDGRAVEIVIEQEPGAAGVAQIASLVQMLAGFKASGRRSTGDKLTRAGPLASQCEAGNVQLLAGAWCGAFLDELQSFPSQGVHDDQVDAASGAFLILAERGPAIGGIISQARTKGWTQQPRRRAF